MRILILSDHIDLQKNRNSILNVYYELKRSDDEVLFLSTGYNILRFIFSKIPIKIFVDYYKNRHSVLKLLFPLQILYKVGLRKYFEKYWILEFVRKIHKYSPEIILAEAGTPSLILMYLMQGAHQYKYIYRINDPIGIFRRNDLLVSAHEYILNNKESVSLKISVPHSSVSEVYDEILMPGLNIDFLKNNAKGVSIENKIVYIGKFPLPSKFIKEVHSRFPDYLFFYTGSTTKFHKKSVPLGILPYAELFKHLRGAGFFVMYFPDSENYQAFLSSNKMIIYSYLNRPILSNINNQELKKNGIFHLSDKDFIYTKHNKNYLSWSDHVKLLFQI